MGNNTRTTGTISTKSIIILSVTLFLIFIIVIAGICARFLLEENVSRIVLISLILSLAIIGIIALIILEVHKRQAVKKQTSNGVATRYGFEPTAPPLSGRTSWAYQKNASKRTTMDA